MSESLPDDEELEETVPDELTITLEIPINKFEAEKKELLEQNGLDVKEELTAQLQPEVENLLHKMYQQGRYQQ